MHLANNWISLAGVVIVTTATIFWLFLLPITLRGETENPYLGILALPDDSRPLFSRDWLLIPLGMLAQAPARRPARRSIRRSSRRSTGRTTNCGGWSTSSAPPRS